MSGLQPPAAYIELLDAAVDDLRGLAESAPLALKWALEKMLMLERDPRAGEPLLGGLVGWRKLAVNDRHWRIVWRIRTDERGADVIEIAEVWAVGARSDKEVYAEMRARVAAMPDGPSTVALADVIDQLGRLAKGIEASSPPAADPLPDWLIDRLVHTVGMDRAAVTVLSLEQAVDRWTEWRSNPR